MYLEEKNNQGNLMPVETDKNGTYILSSKDLCLIKEIPEIIEMKIDSLKIEGRLKTEYYLSTIINTYRTAIDDYCNNPKEYNYNKYLIELEKTKTRGLTTFYFNDKNNKDIQEYEGKQYNPNYEFGGKILEFDGKTNTYIIEIRNRLQINDELEILIPKKIEPEKFKIIKMYDIDTNEKIDHVNPGKEGQKVKLEIPYKCENGWILRRKKLKFNSGKFME
jgi:putative protease